VGYAIDITPEAAKDLESIPLPVAEYLARAPVHDLAESPSTVSRPSAFPYPLRGQAYECSMVHLDTQYRMHVCFQYSQDESTLHILFIGVVRSRA
jgi:hypothetical protein